MYMNKAKRVMRDNRPAVGIGLSMESFLTAEAVSGLGFDFVLMDRQHGNWSLDGILHATRPIMMNQSAPFVRVRDNTYSEIGQVIDRGALGIIVPMVNTKEEAEQVVYAAHYPPLGERSMGYYGAGMYDNYPQSIGQELYVGVQIETELGVNNLKDILSVEGIDGCCVGPKDLAVSLGMNGHPEADAGKFEEVILYIRNICHECGKIPGILGGNANYWFEKGFLFAITGGERDYIINGASNDLKALGRGS